MKYAGNKFEDDFNSYDEAVAVTRYRMADEIYMHLASLAVQTLNDGDVAPHEQLVRMNTQLMLDQVETTLNANRPAWRAYVKRMEAVS